MHKVLGMSERAISGYVGVLCVVRDEEGVKYDVTVDHCLN